MREELVVEKTASVRKLLEECGFQLQSELPNVRLFKRMRSQEHDDVVNLFVHENIATLSVYPRSASLYGDALRHIRVETSSTDDLGNLIYYILNTPILGAIH